MPPRKRRRLAPPCVDTGDDQEEVRCDVRSADMARVHPEVSALATGRERTEHLARCDAAAYAAIAHRFPELRPPYHGV